MTSQLYSKDAVGDLVLLEKIDENEINATLKRRHAKDLIYTYIGNVLLSVNPFKEIRGLYNESEIYKYRNRYIYENPPHIYALSEDTYRSLLSDHEDQCVIISGESGAGKTEASKKIMQYVSAVSGSGEEIERVKNQILKSNPMLEAFGNAKTIRNNNSSRFGKYMEIIFDFKGDPVGGRVTNYLLEKSRVVNPSANERSFHIFYQILEGISSSEHGKYHVKPADQFRSLAKSGSYRVDKMNDNEEFDLTTEGMAAMGMSDTLISEVLRTVMAVLWIGNVEFKGTDKATVEDPKVIDIIADLLHCDKKLLAQAFVSRTITAGDGKPIASPLSIEQARYTRDALAKTIYSRMFDFVVSQINHAIDTANIRNFKKSEITLIGVLDIYGFEIFDNNSFEQFCINFVNEKLQQIFIEKTLKSEQEEYQREGIQWTPIAYFNNKIVCDLIEKKPIGIMSFLDEECLLGKATDLTFLDKIEKNFSDHKHFERPKALGKPAEDFVIKHYAGDVKYYVSGFIDKNKDLVWRDLIVVGESSTMKMFTDATMFPKGGADALGKARPVTAGTQFKGQVNALMETLSKCVPHYIRCIKPNDSKRAGLFEDDRVLHQVRYLGLLENVRVRRAGFAFRQTYDRFLIRYKMLSPETWPNWSGPAREGCQQILKSVKLIEGSQYQLGTTKVFIREPVSLFSLEELRERKLHDIVILIQKTYRSYKARKYFLEMREKSLGLFGRNKSRRRASIRRYFVGDYLNISDNMVIKKLMAKYGDKSVLFADEADKINKNINYNDVVCY